MVTAMSHANEYRDSDSPAPKHDSTSKLPSKSSQPPIKTMARAGLMDHDSRVYLAKKYRTQFASGVGSVLSILVGSPLENIKTRMQSHHFKNALDCMRYTYRTESIRGFWAGTTAPLISITFTRISTFSVYQWAKYAVDAAVERSTGRSPLVLVNTPNTYPDVATIGCFTVAGAMTGAALTPIVAPFELIKNALQTSILMASKDVSRGPTVVQVSPENAGRISSVDAVKQIIQRRGILGLYTGFQLHLARDTIGTGVFFGVYEGTKMAITAYRGGESNSGWAISIAGALCGIMSWCLTYPLDTMKTRCQNMLVGDAAKVAKKVATEGGKAAFRSSKWKGIEMMILRSSIQNMVQMSIFEYMKKRIRALEFSDGTKYLPSEKEERMKRKSGIRN